MKRVTEHLREHLLNSLGYREIAKKLPDLSQLKQSEWCEEFDRARKYRMIMGAFRYGLLSNPDKFKYDMIKSLRLKLDYYEKTGNIEALVDAGNYLMLEFMRPSHQNAHFKSLDDQIHAKPSSSVDTTKATSSPE